MAKAFQLAAERCLSEAAAPERFAISTRVSGVAGLSAVCELGREGMRSELNQSLLTLGNDQVDIFYLHSPDPNVAIEHTLQAVHDMYQAGKFRRVGPSKP